MLRLLGAWNLPAGVRTFLILATVFLIVGFTINVVAAAVRSELVFVFGALIVGAGACCAVAAGVKAGRERGR